ncbi:MAG: toll/interleukin-1 receptor domain-containing protein, partial [Oligoflexia bacterium]|nr:toll/interleukin-1 receptor domain-containing protein [Oligoflexia bacterium]
MPIDYGWDVFICHSSADKQAVRGLAESLRAADQRVWLDEEQIGPGDAVTEKIDEGLRRSRWLLACLSNAQIESGWARAELGAALNAELNEGGKRVIVVVVGELDEERIPMLLRDKRRVDWRSNAGRDELLAWIADAPRRPPRVEPTELRLRLKAVEERIEARWVDREVDPHDFALPMVPGDAEDHRWYLEQYLRLPGPGDHARARRFEKRLQTWGEKLYDALWPHRGPHPLAELAEATGPRILTLISQDPAVLALPWELLRSGEPGA